MTAGGRSGADVALVAALAGGATYGEAGKKADVSERTVRRRMDDPAFKRRVDEARAEMLAQAMGRLSLACTGAATTLALLLGKDNPPAVRLGAARAILDAALRWREQLDIAERLAAIERRLENQ